MQLALATVIVMPLIAILIDRFSENVDLTASLMGRIDWWQQLLIGLAAGVAIALLAWWLISTPMLEKVNTKYSNMLGRFNLSMSEILFISLCAGVGEEILFRGALQPVIGVWLTAIVFVGIHGYLSPTNWRITIYGVVMTVAMAGIGYMSQQAGLISAIAAHTVIDIVLLKNLQETAGKVLIEEKTGLIENMSNEEKEDY